MLGLDLFPSGFAIKTAGIFRVIVDCINDYTE